MSCDHNFEVAASLAGGVTNCPKCRQLLEIPGTPDAGLFWACVGVIGLVVLGIAGLVFMAGEIGMGVTILIVGSVILGLIVMAS